MQNEPYLLVSMPQLGDPNFDHAVVLMIHHDQTGAMGFIVNKPTDISLEVFSSNQEIVCHDELKDLPLYRGGPVETNRGWLLHRNKDLAEKQEIIDGVYLSGSSESLSQTFGQADPNFHLLLGYSGWSPSQLELEMTQGAWLSYPATQKHIFEIPPENLWKSILDEMGISLSQLTMVSGVH